MFMTDKLSQSESFGLPEGVRVYVERRSLFDVKRHIKKKILRFYCAIFSTIKNTLLF